MSVLDEVREERVAQDAQWGGSAHDDSHDSEGWLWLLKERIQKIEATQSLAEFRRQAVVLAALSVAAVESMDRTAVLK